MNNDLISRSALIGVLRSAVDNLISVCKSGLDGQDRTILLYGIGVLSEAIRHVENVPAVDAVEVVRCKDCVLWKPIKEHIGKCPFLIGEQQCTGRNHYCSLGERREAREADSEPVRHGRQKGCHGDKRTKSGEYHFHYYSCNGYERCTAVKSNKSNYCPRCGSIMDLEDDSE